MVLMALYHRERTGEGQSIEVPMFENIARYVLEEHMYHQTFDPPIGTPAIRACSISMGAARADQRRLHRHLGQYRRAGVRGVRRHRQA